MENSDRIKVALIATVVVAILAITVLQQPKKSRAPTPAKTEVETPDEITTATVNTEAKPRARKKKVAAQPLSESPTNATTTAGHSESPATQTHADSVASNLATEPASPAVLSSA